MCTCAKHKEPETRQTISYMKSHFGLNFPLSGQELRAVSEPGW